MPSKRILLVDDEQHIADVVVYVLEDNAFEVVAALDGDTGLTRFKETRPDLVILDINLPGMSGFDLFREMRALRSDAPVIMLTSRGDELDRILGLELGADDYVTKPFSPRELVARVRAVLRRTGGDPGEQKPDTELAHGPLRLDSTKLTVTYYGKRLTLTRAEFRLLECLVRYPARVFTRDVLIDRIHDEQHVVTDRSIDATVKRVRKKCSEIRAAVNPIETVHGLGYKLNQALEEGDGPGA
jgi:DNA-binding response OmpR family regulator